MFLFLATMTFDYLLTAVLVGIAFFALFGARIKMPFSRKAFIALFCIFAFIDSYYLPALYQLDITMRVGNEHIARLYNIEGEIKATDMLATTWLDFVVWILQAAIGHFAGSRVNRIARRVKGA